MHINWLALIDLAAVILGTLSTFLLARAFGPPPKDFGGFSIEIEVGRGLKIVTVNRPDLFKWGLRLLALAFIVQLPKIVIALLARP